MPLKKGGSFVFKDKKTGKKYKVKLKDYAGGRMNPNKVG